MDAQRPIDANVESLASVLRGQRFLLPRHQRPYDWRSEDVKCLLEDLEYCITHKQHHHFLGTIMIVTPSSGDRQEINDGQQRIATFLLICANLCRQFSEHGYSSGENQTLRVLFDLPEGHSKTLDDADSLIPRVILSTNDKATFESLTCGHPVRKNGKMNSAWAAIGSFFDQPAYETLNAKKQFLSFLLNNVLVARLQFKDAVDSITVFETQNTRGKSLEQIQLACTYFFSCLRGNEVQSERMHGQIDSIRTNLRNDENQFFNYARCAGQCRYGHLSKERFCRDLKQVVSGISRSKQGKEVSEFVRVLSEQPRINVFQNLANLRPDGDMWLQLAKDARQSRSMRKITDYLTDLRNYESVSHSILFSLLCRYVNADTKEKRMKAAKFVHKSGKLLASFFQRASHSFPRGFGPSPYEQGVARLAMGIAQGECNNPKQFLEALHDLDKQDDIIPDIPYKQRMELIAFRSKLPVAKYILARINEHIQTQLAVIPERATGEHILPKGKEHLAQWDFTSDEHEIYHHRLGNLTLLAPKDNKPDKKSNSSFAAKQKIYEKSEYLLTQKLAEQSQWNVKNIDMRQKWLADIAAKVWNFRID